MEPVNKPAGTEQPGIISPAIHEFKLLIAKKIAEEMNPLLAVVYRELPYLRPKDMVSHIYDHVVTHAWPQVYVDYSKLLICRGDLEPASKAKASRHPFWVGFEWEDNSFHRNALRHDRAVLIAYCDALGMFCSSTALYTRNIKEARLNIKQFDGFEVQTWMSFIRADGTMLANSVYTGKLKNWGVRSGPALDVEESDHSNLPDLNTPHSTDPINKVAVPKQKVTAPKQKVPVPKKKVPVPKQVALTVPKKATPKAIHKVKQSMATHLANQMEFLLILVYRFLPKQMEPLDAIPLIYDHVITDEWPNVYIDYSKVLVCRGELEPAKEAAAQGFPGYIKFSWTRVDDSWCGRYYDRSIMVAYSESQQKFIFNPWGPGRYRPEAVLKTDGFGELGEVHTWLGFVNEKRNKVANSVYTGKVKVGV